MSWNFGSAWNNSALTTNFQTGSNQNKKPSNSGWNTSNNNPSSNTNKWAWNSSTNTSNNQQNSSPWNFSTNNNNNNRNTNTNKANNNSTWNFSSNNNNNNKSKWSFNNNKNTSNNNTSNNGWNWNSSNTNTNTNTTNNNSWTNWNKNTNMSNNMNSNNMSNTMNNNNMNRMGTKGHTFKPESENKNVKNGNKIFYYQNICVGQNGIFSNKSAEELRFEDQFSKPSSNTNAMNTNSNWNTTGNKNNWNWNSNGNKSTSFGSGFNFDNKSNNGWNKSAVNNNSSNGSNSNNSWNLKSNSNWNTNKNTNNWASNKNNTSLFNVNKNTDNNKNTWNFNSNTNKSNTTGNWNFNSNSSKTDFNWNKNTQNNIGFNSNKNQSSNNMWNNNSNKSSNPWNTNTNKSSPWTFNNSDKKSNYSWMGNSANNDTGGFSWNANTNKNNSTWNTNKNNDSNNTWNINENPYGIDISEGLKELQNPNSIFNKSLITNINNISTIGELPSTNINDISIIAPLKRMNKSVVNYQMRNRRMNQSVIRLRPRSSYNHIKPMNDSLLSTHSMLNISTVSAAVVQKSFRNLDMPSVNRYSTLNTSTTVMNMTVNHNIKPFSTSELKKMSNPKLAVVPDLTPIKNQMQNIRNESFLSFEFQQMNDEQPVIDDDVTHDHLLIEKINTYVQCYRQDKKLVPMMNGQQLYCKPSIAQMKEYNEHQLKNVDQFTIGHQEFGEIVWPGFSDVRCLNIDGILVFKKGSVSVYDDIVSKPQQGIQLNKYAVISLMGVWPKVPKNKVNDEEYDVKCDEVLMKVYARKLSKHCKGLLAEFLSYDVKSGEYKFSVQHFTKYGIPDESDDESEGKVGIVVGKNGGKIVGGVQMFMVDGKMQIFKN